MNAERNFLFACLIFALVIYAIHAFGLFDLLTDLPHLQTLIRQSGLFGYSLYILLFIIATLFLLPGSILVIAGGIVFGPLLGTLLSLIAATLASSCSFLLARWLGRDLLLKYVGHSHTFQAIEKGIARNGIDFLILTRLIPLFPYNIQNYAYGLTTIAFWPYTLISALTTLPGYVNCWRKTISRLSRRWSLQSRCIICRTCLSTPARTRQLVKRPPHEKQVKNENKPARRCRHP